MRSGRVGEGFNEECQGLELVAQRELNLANGAYNGEVTLGSTKCIVSNSTIKRAKDMAVESVWNINLKNNGLIFAYGCAF